MKTDHRIIRKINVIVLAFVLVYGAFFSIAAEVAFAVDLAQDAVTEEVATEDTMEPTQPSPSSETTSEGDTSDPSMTVGKEEPAAGSDDVILPDGEEAIGTDQKEQSEEPEADKTEKTDKAKGKSARETAAASEKSGDTRKVVEVNEPGYEPKRIEEESLISGFKLDFYEHRGYIDYDKSFDADGSIRLNGFFHNFFDGDFGTETLVIELDYGNNIFPFQYHITHYSDGTYEGDLPFGFRVENDDLIIGWLWPYAKVSVRNGELTSSISSDAEAASYEPVLESAEENPSTTPDDEVKGEVVPENSTPRAVVAAEISQNAPPVAEDLPDNDATDNNAVLSSYKKSDSGNAVMDATSDNDSPINATTAMMAGVAALFMITMSLVIVPKV